MTRNQLCRTCWRKLVADSFQQRLSTKDLSRGLTCGISASDGVAERGVQTEGQILVLKDVFETQVGAQIQCNHNILAWIAEFAGTVVNRCEVVRDGKTPFERLRGKQSRLIRLDFGEKVNFERTAVGVRMAKLDSLWRVLLVSLRQWRNRCWNRERRVQDANRSTQGVRTPLL